MRQVVAQSSSAKTSQILGEKSLSRVQAIWPSPRETPVTDDWAIFPTLISGAIHAFNRTWSLREVQVPLFFPPVLRRVLGKDVGRLQADPNVVLGQLSDRDTFYNPKKPPLHSLFPSGEQYIFSLHDGNGHLPGRPQCSGGYENPLRPPTKNPPRRVGQRPHNCHETAHR